MILVKAWFILVLSLGIATLVILERTTPVYTEFEPITHSTLAHTIHCKGLIVTTCHVRLASVIQETIQYREVFDLYDQLGRFDTVYLHIEGDGGSVATTMLLYTKIFYSRAKTITVIEGPVHSGHAIIALMGDEIIIRDHTWFLFHTSSYGMSIENLCIGEKGKLNRGQDAQQKCLDFYTFVDKRYTNFIDNIVLKVLTNDERDRYKEGFDVLIDGAVVRSRLLTTPYVRGMQEYWKELKTKIRKFKPAVDPVGPQR